MVTQSPEENTPVNAGHSFQTPPSMQDAYERAYYEAAGEVPPAQPGPFTDPHTGAQEQSFAEYVSTDAFWAGQAQQGQPQSQQGQAQQAQPFVGNSYQQPWNSGAGQQYQQAYQQGFEQGYQQTYQQSHQGQPYYTQQGYVRTKDHVAAGLLAIFLGAFGVHKFYLGYNTPGFIMLGVTILGSLISFGLAGAVMGVIALVEGIIYLTKKQSEFDVEYVYGHKEWF